MTQDDTGAPDTGATVPPLAVQLVLDGGPMTWDRFQDLDPGQVLDLGAAPEAVEAELLADGVLVGTVALVALGDRLGARIVSMNSDG
ncbi:MAG: FliM/FliN family flagellar motor switch protein [Pseudomonadota bacterium]